MRSIVNQLESAIREGRYPHNTKLPSERTLAGTYQVSLNTARRALQELCSRGLVHRVERGGTFVNLENQIRALKPSDFPLLCINFIENVRRPNDPYAYALTSYLNGYTRGLQHHALRVRFVTLPRIEPRFESVLNPNLPARDQGCIIGDYHSPDLMNWLNERAVPFVYRGFAFYDPSRMPPHHGVYLNRNAASFQATRHLMELGHERIGYIGHTRNWPEKAEAFRQEWWCPHAEGYRAAYCIAGLVPPSDCLADVEGMTTTELHQEIESMLNRPDRPTALVCRNDLTAFVVMKTAARLGLQLPRDLSVTGFDNDPAGAETDPPLTTFDGHEDLAVAAVERLFAIVTDPELACSVQPVECPMIMRGSTAEPPEATGHAC